MIKILIVDDSLTARAVLSHLLEQDPEITVLGFATDGRQAVEMAGKLKPDLITMDIEMPDMNGLEATRLIMAERPIPIVIVTGHANSPKLNVAFEAMKAGALEVIPKPAGFGEEEDGIWGEKVLARIKDLAGIEPRAIADLGSRNAE
jgi:two-component system chemotaxis response regulator CheB